jgi:hypothetical protein
MMKARKSRNIKKKEYFTFMFLPGPNAKVRTLSISKSVIKSALLSVAAVILLSFYLIYEYNDVKDKVWELQSMREELMQQKLKSKFRAQHPRLQAPDVSPPRS